MVSHRQAPDALHRERPGGSNAHPLYAALSGSDVRADRLKRSSWPFLAVACGTTIEKRRRCITDAKRRSSFLMYTDPNEEGS